MLIYDYRDNSVKEITNDKLCYIAPELYAEVEESEYDYYEYSYFTGNNSIIRYRFTKDELTNSNIPFDKMVEIFMESHNVEKYELTNKKFFMTKSTIEMFRDK